MTIIKSATLKPRGINFASALALLFIGLKLTGYIDWSWWWILAPIWGAAVLTFVVGFAIGAVGELKK